MTIIRKATTSDLDTLYQFEQGIITAERPFDSTLAHDPIHYYDLEELIRAEHIELVVAELDGKIIGSGYGRIEKSKSYLKHKYHAYLGFMFVVPEHRGEGVNQKIMAALKTWAKGKGVNELRLEVYTNNASAIHAYEKIGFKKHMIEMRMNLNGEN